MRSRPQREPLCLGPPEKKELRNQGPVPGYALVSLVSLEALVSRWLVSFGFFLVSRGLVSLGSDFLNRDGFPNRYCLLHH